MDHRRSGITPLALAVALALGATLGSALEEPAPSVLAGLIAIPVGLYAALAASRALVPVAVGAAIVGAGVIAFWIYEFVVALSKSS